jgi:hypothetical protein
MHGGKRDGAGRKGLYPTKTIRIPIELESKIAVLVDEYKANLTKEKPELDSVTKSKAPVMPRFPVLNKGQLTRLQKFLMNSNFAKSKTEARKLTDNPKLCHQTFLKYIHLANDHETIIIEDILKLYAID